MTTADFIDHILKNVDEVIFPALTANVAWLLRNWLQKRK